MSTSSPKRRPRTPPHLLEFTKTLTPAPSITRTPKQRVPCDISTDSIITTNESNEPLKLLSKEDIDSTLTHLEAPLKTLEVLYTQLEQLGKTWAKFGTEIDQLSRQKGVGEQAKEGLALWGGIAFMTGIQNEVFSRHLCESVQRPIEKVVDRYGEQRKRLDEQFQLSYHDIVRQLRAAEKAQINLASSKTRNIAIYRSSLEELAANLDTIDTLKKEYYGRSAHLLESACTNVVNIGARTVKLQLEMAANMARKNTNVGGLGSWLHVSEDDISLMNGDDNDDGCYSGNELEQEYILDDPIILDNSTLKATEENEEESIPMGPDHDTENYSDSDNNNDDDSSSVSASDGDTGNSAGIQEQDLDNLHRLSIGIPPVQSPQEPIW